MSEEKLVNFHINAELYHELKILAAREGRKIKDILAEEIAKYVKIHKKGNPQHLMTSFTDNEDFVGFPSMAIDNINKEIWLDKNPKLNDELAGRVQEWVFIYKKRGYRFV